MYSLFANLLLFQINSKETFTLCMYIYNVYIIYIYIYIYTERVGNS